jgi:hypothetical protein
MKSFVLASMIAASLAIRQFDDPAQTDAASLDAPVGIREYDYYHVK